MSHDSSYSSSSRRDPYATLDSGGRSGNKSDPVTRIIEIPVQHVRSSAASSGGGGAAPRHNAYYTNNYGNYHNNNNSGKEDSPLYTDMTGNDPMFHTRSIFDDFDQPFGSPLGSSRSRVERDIDPRFPIFTRFGLDRNDPYASQRPDDFFSSNFMQQQQPRPAKSSSFFANSRNSPARDLREKSYSPARAASAANAAASQSLNNPSTNSSAAPSSSRHQESTFHPESSPIRQQSQQHQQQQQSQTTPAAHSFKYSGGRAVPIRIHHIQQENQSPSYDTSNEQDKHQDRRENSPAASSSSSTIIHSSSPKSKSSPSPPKVVTSTTTQQQQPKEASPLPRQSPAKQPSPPKESTLPSSQSTSDFIRSSASPSYHAQSPPPPPTSSQSAATRKLIERCELISTELNSLQEQVNAFTGRKSDKLYLKIEELITRCLLKLDEIERGEEQLNILRKSLINFAHQLSERLESRANSYRTPPQEQAPSAECASTSEKTDDVKSAESTETPNEVAANSEESSDTVPA